MTPKAKPIYSVRDALGRELWWTSARYYALKLAAGCNERGVGAVIVRGVSGVYVSHVDDCPSPTPQGLSAEALPVRVWQVELDGGVPKVCHPDTLAKRT